MAKKQLAKAPYPGLPKSIEEYNAALDSAYAYGFRRGREDFQAKVADVLGLFDLFAPKKDGDD